MKVFVGKVISCKLPKTAIVLVERVVSHKIYKRRFKRTKKYMVHDELGVKEGNVVKFTPSRPYSKRKRWKIIEVLESKKVGKNKPVLNKK